MLLVVWKKRPVKVSPLPNAAAMEPHTLPEPVQLNCTEFAPDTVAPVPVLTVAQPAASATSSRNPIFNVVFAIRCQQRRVVWPRSGKSVSQLRQLLDKRQAMIRAKAENLFPNNGKIQEKKPKPSSTTVSLGRTRRTQITTAVAYRLARLR
jgi:hypothetical protein